jgi:hypothetical protein
LETIEDEYNNLANYSNKLIRAGALPGGKKGAGGAGGIYYAMEKVANPDMPDAALEEEALEAIAKRRAIIKDSWDFYRMICSLLRDRHKYDEIFRRLQLDPVYPYLNSMTGLHDNDNTGSGYENPDKEIMQIDLPEYAGMQKLAVAHDLVAKAQAALPSLVEICKALAGSLVCCRLSSLRICVQFPFFSQCVRCHWIKGYGRSRRRSGQGDSGCYPQGRQEVRR